MKYLNNIVEQDHRAIKRRGVPMMGFKSFPNAAITLMSRLGQLPKKSALAKAIRYAVKPTHWPALMYYCSDGHVEIDNNAAERSLRTVALGIKSYLFAGSDVGGERAAAMYSLIGSCKLNKLDPESYLRHVSERIADHPINRIDELLPWNVVLALPLTISQAA